MLPMSWRAVGFYRRGLLRGLWLWQKLETRSSKLEIAGSLGSGSEALGRLLRERG